MRHERVCIDGVERLRERSPVQPEIGGDVDKHVALANEYAPLKQRIEARVKELEAPPPDDGPQGPTEPAPKAPAPKAPAPGKKPAGPMPF